MFWDEVLDGDVVDRLGDVIVREDVEVGVIEEVNREVWGWVRRYVMWGGRMDDDFDVGRLGWLYV